MTENIFVLLIDFAKQLGVYMNQELMRGNEIDIEGLIETSKKFLENEKDKSPMGKATFDKLKRMERKLGVNLETIFKGFLKIAMIMNSEEEFFKELSVEEMGTYEFAMKKENGAEFEKIQGIWQRFKSGGSGFSEYVNGGFEILGNGFFSYVLPIIDKKEFIIK